MKVIIEASDVAFGAILTPGVYEVDLDLDEINMMGTFAQSLSFTGTMDLTQEPDKRHWFNVDQHEGKIEALQPFPKGTNLGVELEVLPAMSATSSPCNKSLHDCVKHGNQKRFGGHTNHATGKGVPCPYDFGSPLCSGAYVPSSSYACAQLVVGTQLRRNNTPRETFTISKIFSVTPGSDSDRDVIEVSWPNNGNSPATYSREGLVKQIQDGKVTVVLPSGLAPGQTVGEFYDLPVSLDLELTQVKDCDECYGTGLFKGFGGPCSKGCPIKRGK